MANSTKRTMGRSAPFIAPLTPDSPDPDAQEDATNLVVLAALEAGRLSARESGEEISQEELRRELAPTDDEIAAARAELDAMEAEEQRPRRRASGPRPTVPNGKILVRVPLSVHRELIERAEAERTSLNQLVLAYISRGLGTDAA